MQLKEICRKIAHIIHRISNVFAWISGISLFAMALLTFFDVFGRYVFNKPIKGTQEIVELMMVIVVYYGLAYATHLRKHITVDALLINFSMPVQSTINGLTSLLCIFVSAPIAVRLTVKGMAIMSKTNVATGTLGIQLAPFYIIAAIGCYLASLEFFIDGISRFNEAVTEFRSSKTAKEGVR